MVSKRMLQLGTARSVIRELFEYGNQRVKEVGRENVFDFSLGNPSVPAPDAVNEMCIRDSPLVVCLAFPSTWILTCVSSDNKTERHNCLQL